MRRGAGRPAVAVCIDTRDGPGRERLRGVYRFAVERGWRLYLVRGEGGPDLARLKRLPVDGAILYDKPPSVHRILRARACSRRDQRPQSRTRRSRGVRRRRRAGADGGGAPHGPRNPPFRLLRAGAALSSKRRAGFFSRHLAARGFSLSAFDESLAEGEADLEGLIRWLRRLPKPAGLLAYDDKMAERVLAACAWGRISVPQEVAVLGIGNDELMCQLAQPSLSSVALPTVEIGLRAAERLDVLLRGGAPRVRHEVLAPREVIARASTDRFPTADPAVARAIAHICRERLPSDRHRPGGRRGRPVTPHPRAALPRDDGPHGARSLIERRMRRAAELLRLTDCSIPEAARRCGYGALSAFIRAFAKQTGCHPRTYRSRYR